MFYFLNISYFPHTALTNRLNGYYKSFDEFGYKAKVIYLLPDSKGSKQDLKFNNIKILYYWKFSFNNSILRYIFFYLNLWRFLLTLNENDVVYTYGLNKATKKLVEHHVQTIAEITEHPSILDGGKTTAISEEKKYETALKLNKLFVISTSLKNLFVSHGVNADKINIINMTVDPERFSNLKKSECRERYIAYCGNASNNKDGVDKLIKSFAIVSKSHPDIKLYIIGKAPSKGILGSNIDLADSLGIKDKVRFTGLVSADKIPQLLFDAEVLALNRPDSEQAQYGFPTKLGEYLLTGNPVVVTSVGDIPLFFKDGENILFSSPSDDNMFAEKLCYALDNPQKSKEIGEAGKQIALQYFNSKNEALKILNSVQ